MDLDSSPYYYGGFLHCYGKKLVPDDHPVLIEVVKDLSQLVQNKGLDFLLWKTLVG